MENDIISAVWPEWRTVKRISRGSFGVVYEAIHADHGVESHAAIKVISIPQDESEIESLRLAGLTPDATKAFFQGVVNDFVNEISIMESFKGSQNIVSVEDFKVVEKTDRIGYDIFIRMELLTPLSIYISDKTLSENDVIELGSDICSALERCARRNVIHRDIKPENIFVNEFGDYKLGDFGIARKLENVTGGLSQKGTINYMAPEVFSGRYYDATVDIYSLGIVLYWLMNKRRLPFISIEQQLIRQSDIESANRRRMSGEPIPPPCDASYEMAQVILMACDPNPDRRFATATAMKNALLNARKEITRTVRSGNGYATDAVNGYFGQKEIAERTSPIQEKTVVVANPENKKSTAAIVSVIVIFLLVIGGWSFVYFGNRTEKDFGKNDTTEESAGKNDDHEDSDQKDKADVASEDEEPVASDGNESVNRQELKQNAVNYQLPIAVPEEYYYYNGHTYAFYDASRYNFTSYDEVSEFCHNQGGHLAVINDRSENSYLYNLMKDNYSTTVFFGYTDKDEEGNWCWDGDESDYENWTRSGDWDLPDNGEGWGGGEWKNGGEDYAEFNYDRLKNWGAPNDTTWNDAVFMENTTIFFCEWEFDMREAEAALSEKK